MLFQPGHQYSVFAVHFLGMYVYIKNRIIVEGLMMYSMAGPSCTVTSPVHSSGGLSTVTRSQINVSVNVFGFSVTQQICILLRGHTRILIDEEYGNNPLIYKIISINI